MALAATKQCLHAGICGHHTCLNMLCEYRDVFTDEISPFVCKDKRLDAVYQRDHLVSDTESSAAIAHRKLPLSDMKHESCITFNLQLWKAN